MQIVSIFQRQGNHGLSFEEVNEKLKGMAVDENQSISLRTFQRDLKDIESSLNIRIIYSKTQRKYVLETDYSQLNLKNDQLFTMESIAQLNIAQDVASNDFILIEERKPLGLENYNIIKEAIIQQKYLMFDYQKFDQYKANQRKIIPIALKEKEYRWYVVGNEFKNGLKDRLLKTFALDRMFDTRVGPMFVLNEGIDVQNYFKEYYGISTNAIDGFTNAVNVKIETSIEYGKYFSTLPIHASQKTEIENGKTILSFRLIPTMEFIAELLSHNTKIRVIEPVELVKVVKEILLENIAQYS